MNAQTKRVCFGGPERVGRAFSSFFSLYIVFFLPPRVRVYQRTQKPQRLTPK